MSYQTTFKRYELKYRLNALQKEIILAAMAPYMKLDGYGRTTIRNIYFDTPDYRLIRESIEKPTYKEKLRIRSYNQTVPEDPVFIELKKKYKSIVYKRRLSLPEAETMRCFREDQPLPVYSQIADEIAYFRSFYKNLQPAVFLSYEREAFFARNGSDFRVTFDENILYRTDQLSLGSEISGTPVLNPSLTLMEIKTSGGFPLWMTHALTDLHLAKTSFSKYGSAYKDIVKQKYPKRQFADTAAVQSRDSYSTLGALRIC